MAEREMVEMETNNGSGVEVVESPQPANDESDSKERPPTLTQRMMAIRAESSGVGKENIKMGSYSIKAHTIEGVLHGVRALLDRYGVWMQPNLVERTFNGNRCDVIFDFYFENLDDAEDRKVIRYAGSGTDNSDKGFAKAGTNALKEMLKKVFLITDREDAKEETDQVQYQSNEGATRAEVDEALELRRKAIEQWAKGFKGNIEAAKTLKDLQRLERENRDQLTSEDLQDVTRDYFVELIQTRKSAIETAEPLDN